MTANEPAPARGSFPATRLSLVEAARSPDAATRERGLATLLSAYWRPVYRYVRLRHGKGHEEAADLVQDFFAELIERDLLARFDPSRARLRTYLRVCVDGLAANQARAASRQKRGGGERPLSLDLESERSAVDRLTPADGSDPEQEFEKAWARSVFSLSLDRFRERLAAAGKAVRFELFSAVELGEEGRSERPSYAELARRHGISESDVTNGLHAARREFRETVLELLRETTATEEEFRLEARSLLGLADPPPKERPGAVKRPGNEDPEGSGRKR
ncbi:MAG: sigma-70 family RNA polymerase sigma factor [Acidobacteria bacterium]|nr:MAG: sigma-70 family RNA polymerase sigma factor [Acidobacteriota bacterium]MCE7960240.1 sigma-70 family RNA polymerase sigma factor [Acidobacteria bacterium ACB2]